MRLRTINHALQYLAMLIAGGALGLAVIGILSSHHEPGNGITGQASIEYRVRDGIEVQVSGDDALVKVIRDLEQKGKLTISNAEPWYKVLQVDKYKMLGGARYLIVNVSLKSNGPDGRATLVKVVGFSTVTDLNRVLDNTALRDQLGIFGTSKDLESYKVP